MRGYGGWVWTKYWRRKFDWFIVLSTLCPFLSLLVFGSRILLDCIKIGLISKQ
jgi:hypothetical protein